MRKTRSPATAALDGAPPATITAMYTASAVPRPPGVTGMLPASIPNVKAANTTARLAFEAGMPANRIDNRNTRNAASWLEMDVQVSQNQRVRATSMVCRRMSTIAGSSEVTGPLRKGRRNADATCDVAECAGYLLPPQH